MYAHKALPALLASTFLLSGAVALQAQDYYYDSPTSNVAVEAKIGTTVPVGDLADQGAESGLALSANLLYNFSPRWTGYFGWDRHSFNCSGCINEIGTSSGPNMGVKYLVDWNGTAAPWLRGGVMFSRLDSFQAGADVESNRSVGLELGTGVDFNLTERVTVAPLAMFNYYNASDLPVEDYTMSYFIFGLSGHYHF